MSFSAISLIYSAVNTNGGFSRSEGGKIAFIYSTGTGFMVQTPGFTGSGTLLSYATLKRIRIMDSTDCILLDLL